jgi:hypothetical protein
MFTWSLVNNLIQHKKCEILRFTIVVFRIMEPRNIVGGYMGFHWAILLPSSGSQWRPIILLCNIHKHVPDYIVSCPRLYNESSPLWAAKILYKKYWKQLMCIWKCNIGITVVQEETTCCTCTAFNIMLFPTNCVHIVSYCACKTKETRSDILVTHILSINTHFWVRTTYDEFESSTKIIPHGQSHTKTNCHVEMSRWINYSTVEKTASITYNCHHTT